MYVHMCCCNTQNSLSTSIITPSFPHIMTICVAAVAATMC